MPLQCERGRISQVQAQLRLCAEKSASGIADQKIVKPTRLTKVITNSQYRGFWGEVEMRLSGHSVARTNVFLDHTECERIAQ